MISRKDLYKEIPTPQEVEKQEEPKILMLLYKLGFMILRIVLDNRLNLQKLEKGKDFKKREENPVIKNNMRFK